MGCTEQHRASREQLAYGNSIEDFSMAGCRWGVARKGWMFAIIATHGTVMCPSSSPVSLKICGVLSHRCARPTSLLSIRRRFEMARPSWSRPRFLKRLSSIWKITRMGGTFFIYMKTRIFHFIYFEKIK